MSYESIKNVHLQCLFCNTQWVCQGVELSQLMPIFTSKKVWKFLVKNQLKKSDPKNDRVWKVPIRINRTSKGNLENTMDRTSSGWSKVLIVWYRPMLFSVLLILMHSNFSRWQYEGSTIVMTLIFYRMTPMVALMFH